jgi:hypothetical protein
LKEKPRYFVGEYVDAKASAVRAASRWLFIQAIDRLVPKCFPALRNDLYPAFVGLPSPNAASDRKAFEFLFWRWASKYNLEHEKWIREGALETLSRWQRFPRMRKDLDLSAFRNFPASTLVVPAGIYPFHFEDPGWDPRFAYSQWLDAARNGFEESAAIHREKVRQFVRDQGWKKARVYNYEHLEWLVLWQCGGLSIAAIRKRYPMIHDWSTIWKGVRSANAVVELARLRSRTHPIRRLSPPSS